MLKVLLKNHDYNYEVGELIKLFTSQFEFTSCNDCANELLINEVFLNENKYISKAYYYKNNELVYETEEVEKITSDLKKESKIIIKRNLFNLLKLIYNSNVPWGILTGIRPTKIVHELLDKNKSKEEIYSELSEKYYMSQDKAQLAFEVAIKERKFVHPPDENKISLYISIPFCTTRCVYCSFPSNTLKQWGHLKKAYLEALIKEIRGVALIVEKLKKEVQTVYIGGGTPTTLSGEELDILINELYSSFDLSNMIEFTVEAGRVDTIDEEKLKVMKKHGVTRISINPQTMNEETLVSIGRTHSVEDIVKTFKIAREIGFDNINMDVILGLPKETPLMVEKTMLELSKLCPDSITVHTMAIKRASTLKENIQEYELSQYRDMIEMIDISMNYAKDMNLQPYYMYRQKHMLGNLENIGYSRIGCECVYNIQIMEEKQSIFALGAGAISKIVYLNENRIERVPNVKNIEHYINRVDEMIQKKKKEVLEIEY